MGDTPLALGTLTSNLGDTPLTSNRKACGSLRTRQRTPYRVRCQAEERKKREQLQALREEYEAQQQKRENERLALLKKQTELRARKKAENDRLNHLREKNIAKRHKAWRARADAEIQHIIDEQEAEEERLAEAIQAARQKKKDREGAIRQEKMDKQTRQEELDMSRQGGLDLGKHRGMMDGVPESQRKYIQDGAGIDIPIGIFESNWASSWLLNKLTEMLVQEVMGYHAKVDPRMGANGASCFYALPGCMDFDNKIVAEKQCGINETTLHISVDSWVGSYASAMDQFNKEFPRIASVDLGSMGYAGEESMYVSQAILNDAYGDSGLALDFYKSYNTTHHNPRRLTC
eukprot:g33355.t1